MINSSGGGRADGGGAAATLQQYANRPFSFSQSSEYISADERGLFGVKGTGFFFFYHPLFFLSRSDET